MSSPGGLFVQLFISVFFLIWNSVVFYAVVVPAVATFVREPSCDINTLPRKLFFVAFFSPFVGAGLFVPVLAGPISTVVGYLPIVGAIFKAVKGNLGMPSFFQPARRALAHGSAQM